MDAKQPNRWALFERAFLILPTILIAVIVWFVASGAERERLRLEYVRIATAILQQRPQEPDNQRIMREWAVAVLNRSSPVNLSKEQADALIDGTSKLAPYPNDWGYTGGLVYDDDVDPRATKKPSPSPKPQ